MEDLANIGAMTQDDAKRIAQDFLDRQGAATMSGDVDATLDWCDIPCTMESLEGRTVATTTDEMRAICVAFIARLKTKRLTHMIRRCTEAKFKDADTIWATYETRYISEDNTLSEETYLGFVILRRFPDRWKISTIQFAVTGDTPVNATLKNWPRDSRAS